MFLSPAVENGSEPVWNHVGEIVNFSIGNSLQFSVWDNSAAPAPDVRIGTAVVAASYFQENPHGFEGDLPLTDDNGEATGVLAIKIHILPADTPTGVSTLHGMYMQPGRTEVMLGGTYRNGIVVAEKRWPPMSVGAAGVPLAPLTQQVFHPMQPLAVPPMPRGGAALQAVPRQPMPQQAVPHAASGLGRHGPFKVGSFHPAMPGQSLHGPPSGLPPGSPVPVVPLAGAPGGQKFQWAGAAPVPMQVPGAGPMQPYQRPMAPMPFR